MIDNAYDNNGVLGDGNVLITMQYDLLYNIRNHGINKTYQNKYFFLFSQYLTII